ncbi:uncharacterized protein EV422DRAFT_603707 [Fimicolochytrium jonesii]|uniref:uncharacterized protein n=1 Tax=Fimicolochytrium jonesii TaxID=1396493 RepID=UPI0022FDE42A|nr:uncharacterized protein EV422DRAFT_603707 [Fimicolochytrium jonesii]KAI8817881.1 hypothetical protein EV422DRAFT_603707 [Fimicolochytrium jonesii]
MTSSHDVSLAERLRAHRRLSRPYRYSSARVLIVVVTAIVKNPRQFPRSIPCEGELPSAFPPDAVAERKDSIVAPGEAVFELNRIIVTTLWARKEDLQPAVNANIGTLRSPFEAEVKLLGSRLMADAVTFMSPSLAVRLEFAHHFGDVASAFSDVAVVARYGVARYCGVLVMEFERDLTAVHKDIFVGSAEAVLESRKILRFVTKETLHHASPVYRTPQLRSEA